MKKIYITVVFLILFLSLAAQEGINSIRLTLNEAILLAQGQSVDAAVVINELKSAYWQYRTHRADQLPEVRFTGSLPNYYKIYDRYQNADGSYTYVRNNYMGVSGELAIDQNIPLTGGQISVNTKLDFTRQFGGGAYNEFMSVPVGITLTQPVFGVNNHKWNRKIEPVRYEEAKADYMENVEWITISTVNYFFNLLLAKENLATTRQNLANAEKLYEIALAKREIGHISESELMQLNLSALQAKGKLTEAESSLNAMMFQLRSFLGLSEDDMIDPVLPGSAPLIRLVYGDVLEKAQQNNALAKSILRQQYEADYEVAKAKGKRREIAIHATVGYTGKDRLLKRSYHELMTNQIVEVGVTIPLLDWGKRKGQVKVAESNRDLVQARTRQDQMNFNQDIYLLVENFNNQAGQLEIAEQADVIAERRYQTAIETFLIGKINILDLNDAQNAKDEARDKRIRELYAYWRYFYNIRSLTLYDFIAGRTIDADIEKLVSQ